MPGYKTQSMYATPQPTEKVDTLDKRFVLRMPKLSVIQLILIGLILAHVWTSRKANTVVISTIALSLALLHTYDHVFLIQRGPERRF
jgi:hypothetical protein